jgi:basic membrane protein A
MKLLTPGVFNLIKAVQDDTFEGGNIVGEVGLAPFHDNEDKVPADVKTRLDEIAEGLQDGSIKTCVSPAKGAPAPEGCSDTGTGDAMTTPTP